MMHKQYRLDRLVACAGWALLVVAGLAGCGADGTHTGQCQEARVTALPFRVVGGHLVVDARINGAPVALMFDTGSFTTVLTDEAVERAGLRTDNDQVAEATGIGGIRTLSAVYAKTFEMGELRGDHMGFVASDISWSESEKGIDGILSTDFLSKYDIDLDIPAGKIILYYPVGDCSHPAAALSGPLYFVDLVHRSEDRDPRVETVIGGQHFISLVDTGSPDTTIYRGTAAALGLRMSALVTDPHFMTGGFGPSQVRAVQHVLAPITVGDLEIQHLPVTILDQQRDGGEDLLLGMDFMSRVHVWISNSSHTLIMQFPPSPSPDLNPGNAGTTTAAK